MFSNFFFSVLLPGFWSRLSLHYDWEIMSKLLFVLVSLLRTECLWPPFRLFGLCFIHKPKINNVDQPWEISSLEFIIFLRNFSEKFWTKQRIIFIETRIPTLWSNNNLKKTLRDRKLTLKSYILVACLLVSGIWIYGTKWRSSVSIDEKYLGVKCFLISQNTNSGSQLCSFIIHT